jgi:hypothetical protein
VSRLRLRLLAATALIAATAGAGALTASPAFALGPSNDHLANAAPLAGVFGSYTPSLNNSSATIEPGEPNHYNTTAPSHSVWFRWTAPATADAVFRTKNSKFDTVLAVYRQDGSGFGGLTRMDSNDDAIFGTGPSTQSQLSFNSAAGQEYLIVVASYGSGTGDVSLSWTANDDFHAARVLTGPAFGGSIVAFSNDGTSTEIQERAHAGDPAQHSVWFNWTAPRNGVASFESTLDNYDTQIAVYTGLYQGAVTLVAENDDATGASGHQAKVLFNAISGTTYRIVLDGYNGQSGSTAIKYTLV